MKLSEYVTQVINDPKYGHDLKRAHAAGVPVKQEGAETDG